MFAHLISADWSKKSNKRSVYTANISERKVQKEQPNGSSWNLDTLLDLANRYAVDGPVLIGLDLALGIPNNYWRLIRKESRATPPKSFLEWLKGIDQSGRFFETVCKPDQWCIDCPWFKVPPGRGGLNSFTKLADDGMLRKIDKATGAKPIFAVSGIPGTVGSGTRSFWKELIPQLNGKRDFAVWPFEGQLDSLGKEYPIVLCETYPRLAYAAALAPRLPYGQILISKTNSEIRNETIDSLYASKWVQKYKVDLESPKLPKSNEDDFDAFLSGAALLRCLLEDMKPDDPQWIDPTAEGSMLLSGIVDPSCKCKQFKV